MGELTLIKGEINSNNHALQAKDLIDFCHILLIYKQLNLEKALSVPKSSQLGTV